MNLRAPARSDPHAMSTVRATGTFDPPQISTNVIGQKKIRHIVPIAAGVGALTLGDIRSCLPLTNPELRILKLSAWGPDGTVSATSQLSVVFPVGLATNLVPGDNAVWVDEGTTGQQRAQIHLTPCFDYRNFWFLTGLASTTVLATFGTTTLATSVIVDITVQFRTAVQTCPALEHLRHLIATADESEDSTEDQ